MGAPPSSNFGPGLSDILASYLPRYQAQLIRDGVRPRPEPFSEEKAGVILIIDVSGFTALTERFAQQGGAGGEQLSGILNRYFGRVTELITAQGGDIVAFAGDAALAMWPGDQADLACNILRATQSALDIQSELDGFTPAEGVVLRQRAGIGCGTLRLMELGGVRGRWQFVVVGEPVTEASWANHAAEPGSVVLGVSATRLVKDRIDGVDLPSGLFKVSTVRAGELHSLPQVSAERTTNHASADLLRHYVPLVVADRVWAGQEQWIAEFRTLTMMFVNLSDSDRDRDAGIGVLHSRVQRIQATLQAYEGTLYQFLMDDKGLTAVCAFGLPPLAHEDDARRAAEAALSLRDELARMDAMASVGIATGTVFCGVYGNDSRRQYTTLGNTVNLASRLMQSAPSSVLCDEAAFRAAQPAAGMHFASRGEITIKGRSMPIAVFAPGRDSENLLIRTEPSTGLEIIGRDSERAAFGRALDNLIARGESACVIIEGEAGIGKTTLLEEFARQAHNSQTGARTISCWRAAGDSIQQAAPYLAWRGVFREAFRLANLPQTEWREHVLTQLFDDSELRALAPLLNAVLPLEIPSTPVTDAMEGQALAENTQHLLISLLKSRARDSSLILLLEDAHWFDSASWRLALLAMQQVKPVLIALATRPLTEPPTEFTVLQGTPSTQKFSLPPLDSDSILKMVCRRLGVNRLPAEIARFITERGKGHPLFSEQLGYALRDTGLILISGRECRIPESATGAAFDAALDSLRFPSTLEGVINSRLDRLPQEVQLTVKVASVIGQRFSQAALRGVHPVAAQRAEIAAHLESAEKLDLIQPVPHEAEEYAFRQTITQEVAYNSVPFAQRRQIHRAVGEWLEHKYSADLTGQYPLLAHHWRFAEDAAKAVHYCSEAGSQALRNNANQEAVRFLSGALEIAEQQRGSQSLQRSEWELQLGKAYVNWSKYIEARAHLERGLRLQGQSVPDGKAGAAGALFGQVMRQCLHRGLPSRFVGRRKDQSESLRKFSRTYEALTEIYYLQDMPLQCLLAVFRSLNLAELAGSSPELARGYSSTGSLVGFMTLHKAANAYFKLAEQTSDQIRDPASRAWIDLARGMYLAGIGQWDLAANLFAEAITINDGIGDRRRGDDNRMTSCTLQYLQGRFAESLRTADALYKSAGDRLDSRCQAEALRIKAYNFVALDRMTELQDCVDELDSLRTAQMKFGGTHQKQDVHALYAILHMSAGNRQEALESAARSVKALAVTSNSFFDYLLERSALAELYLQLLEADRGNRALRVSVQRSLKALHAYSRVFSIGRPLTAVRQGTFFWLEGKQEKAIKAWRQALEFSNNLKAPYYQGLAHASLGLYSTDSAERQSHLQQARELLRQVNAVRDLTRLECSGAAKD
jgi:class 3 adenylate cyclase/tetratricopeptide (TPR) repeat protein